MYKVVFSYKLASGKWITESDTSSTWTAQEAVDQVRSWYGDLVGLRIEQVFVDRQNRWEVTEAWD